MSGSEFWLALSTIEGIGPVRIKYLISRFGTIEKVFEADLLEIARLPLFDQMLAVRVQRSRFGITQLKRRIAWLRDRGVEIVTIEDDRYPSQLKKIQNFPPILCRKGELIEIPENAIAIVGTRNPSEKAIIATLELTDQLVSNGFTIVSGLAKGIDTTAHVATLSSAGETVAVIGTDLFSIYPHENAKISEQIAKTGAIISEHALPTSVTPINLILRNRIISGLCMATIVVETTENGGAMRTATYARDQGRYVCAIDWKSLDRSTSGNRKLIQLGAYPIEIEKIDDFVSALKDPESDQKLHAPIPSAEQMALF